MKTKQYEEARQVLLKILENQIIFKAGNGLEIRKDISKFCEDFISDYVLFLEKNKVYSSKSQ